MLIKLCDLDSARHTYGVESAEAETQLRMHDEQLGAIMECLRRRGTLDETNIIVLGDHGQTDIRDAFLMNVYFRRLGLLTGRCGRKDCLVRRRLPLHRSRRPHRGARPGRCCTDGTRARGARGPAA